MVVQELSTLQPKWSLHLWLYAEKLGWCGMAHFQRGFPIPQVHRDEDAFHLTQHKMCTSVFINDMCECV